MSISIDMSPLVDPKCVICLDNENISEELILKCQHSFHRACIEPWLKDHGTCPTCRQTVVKPSEHYEVVGIAWHRVFVLAYSVTAIALYETEHYEVAAAVIASGIGLSTLRACTRYFLPNR